jgi:poly(hydroxyalkanoate) depolymerase family esterase
MSARSRTVAAALHFAALSLGASPAFAAWATVDYGNDGADPTMTLYTPTTPDASPGVIVALHFCGGTAANAQGWFQTLANQYGFLIIAPDVGPADCWNANPQRAGEPAAIVQMVDYVLDNHDADPSRIFVAGSSSGGCMTEALLAAYPDVFAAGAALAGVPAGQWTGGNTCNGSCNTEAPSKTAEQWGDLVRAEAPQGFDGPWPRFQLFHGTTDGILYPSMIDAQVAQWTNVHGLTEDDASSVEDSPISGWTRKSYKDDSDVVLFEVITGVATGTYEEHDLTPLGLFPDVVRFFGLDMDPPAEPGGDGEGGAEGEGGAGGADEGIGGASQGGASAGGEDSGGTTSDAGAPSTSGGSSSSGGSSGAPSGTGGDSPDPSRPKTPDVGCGCRVTGAGSGTLGSLTALAAGLGMLLRRRQRAAAKRD